MPCGDPDEPAPVAGAGLLARVPRGKVTVAKEIIRLAGDLRTDDAFAFLARIEGDGKLHPDVAIALMRAYWNFLEHPEVWQRLHAAARSEQPRSRARPSAFRRRDFPRTASAP